MGKKAPRSFGVVPLIHTVETPPLCALAETTLTTTTAKREREHIEKRTTTKANVNKLTTLEEDSTKAPHTVPLSNDCVLERPFLYLFFAVRVSIIRYSGYSDGNSEP